MTNDIPEIPKNSSDTAAEIKAQLSAVYPGLFDGDGNLVKAEFEKLATNFEATDEREKYEFNWTGKTASKRVAYTPSKATLRPDPARSQSFDKTANAIVEGDNLEVLKLLQKSYSRQIKCIYIDPPYNTGNDFVYRDNFASRREAYWQQAGYKNTDGVRLDTNSEANGRYHSDWLSMMQSRLLLARQLLRDDGVIFVSIDDHEVDNLRKLMDEVFGPENFVAQLIWKSRQIVDSRSQNGASTDHEYVLVYGKTAEFNLRGKKSDITKYSNPDDDTRGPWMSNSILGLGNLSQRPNLHYEITDPATNNTFSPPSDSGWRYSRETMGQKIAEGRIVFPSKKDGRPREKKFISELRSEFTGLSSLIPLEVGYTLNGTREVRDIFGASYFDFPKPVSLIRFLIEQATSAKENDIVMDFFAGSGTTAEAVNALNAEDSGNRRFILVQMPEATDPSSEAYAAGYKTISQICVERIKRTSAKLTQGDIDTGFKVFELSASNFPENNFIPDTDKTPAENTKLFDIYVKQSSQASLFDTNHAELIAEIALKDGFTLDFTAQNQSVFTHNKVEFLDDGTKSALICLDTSLDPVTIEQLREYAGTRFICLEAALDTSKKWTLKQILGSNLWVA